MNSWPARALRLTAFIGSVSQVWAGGSGLNVAVVVNQNSTNSVELGNYYCEQRQVPPQNFIRVNWTGGNAVWTKAQFDSALAIPVYTEIASRGLTNQIDFIVLSLDIPYRITNSVTAVTNNFNSTTAALFYGFKNSTLDPNLHCTLAADSEQAYAGSEDVFRSTAAGSGRTNALVIMLTASNLALAKQLVDQGVRSDGAFPTQTVLLAKSTDTARNVRYWAFDDALFNTRLHDGYLMARTNTVAFPPPLVPTNLLGYQDGLYQFLIRSNSFVSGAMADSLTSIGGKLYEPNDHTILLNFIHAGAAGSYGTVIEPCAYPQKFPSPQNYFYQARGFSLTECYYQSVTNPYMGLIVGEPLAAPFAKPATGFWINLPADAVLSGMTNLSLQFNAADAEHPVQQVDLFVDSVFGQTLTNIPPGPNNVLYITLPGKTNIDFTVPPDATIKSVADGLAEELNRPRNKNFTQIEAFAHGDRIELQSLEPGLPGGGIPVSVSQEAVSLEGVTTFLHASRPEFLDSIAWGIREFTIAGFVVVGDYFQLTATKTNGAPVVVSITNNATGLTLLQFVQQFLDAINAAPDLQGADGLAAEDLVLAGADSVQFNLRARGQGYDAAQIQALVDGSFFIDPTNAVRLDENLSDLRPRNHLYVTAGTTNLPLTFAFDTTALPDGYHELTAVAYEGSHVRTQKRISQTVRIQNTPLSAMFTTLVGDTNTALEATLKFSVVASTTNVATIELFSTGGSVGLTNKPTADFAVAGTNLGGGLHPFYAMVTDTGGQRYRTETKWIRLVRAESPFTLHLVHPPSSLFWPATAGRSYDVLSTTNLLEPFQFHSATTPSNSSGQWIETNPPDPQRFYRVRVSP